MTEHKYAFLKDNRVHNVIVLDAKNDAEAELHKTTYGYDEFIYVGIQDGPAMHSLRVGKDFVVADWDYLKSINLSQRNNAEQAAWELENAD
jgi:Trm5-related predicted tRNA methylase